MEAATLNEAKNGHAVQPPASGLPACDIMEVVFLDVVKPFDIFEIKDMKSGNDTLKRSCYVFFGSLQPGMRSSFEEIVFTLEWLNKMEGRWRLEVRKRQLACRGTSHDLNDYSRCQ